MRRAIMVMASRRTSRMAEAPVAPSDSDFTRAAYHDERHHTIKADQRKQQRQSCRIARRACARYQGSGWWQLKRFPESPASDGSARDPGRGYIGPSESWRSGEPS